MTGRPGYDGVMLIGFGGPTRADEVRPFLDKVLRERRVPRERYEEVVHHYAAIGGRSPYNELTMAQAAALKRALERAGLSIQIVVGMRNWAPYLEDALRGLAAAGARRVLGLILAAHRCEASWERYQLAVDQARSRLGRGAPEVDYGDPCYDHPLFIEAIAERVREALARLLETERSRARLVFTAHSIPVAMAARSPYVDELTESCRLVAGRLGFGGFTLAFQSRSGDPREPWLEPDIGTVLARLVRGEVAVVVPVGFLCDHLEVLYDLDIEAAALAREHGVKMVRGSTVGDHPRFIEMMASVVRQKLVS